MFLVYQPDGEDERRWVIKPRRMSNFEAEAIEKRTGMTFEQFGEALLRGSTLARRALLWTMLRREHPTVKFEDVSFAMGELRIEQDRQELLAMREMLATDYEFESEAIRSLALAQVDKQIAEAPDDPDPKVGGKGSGSATS